MSAFIVSDTTMQQVVFSVLHLAAGNFGHGEYRFGRTKFHTDATSTYVPLAFGAFVANDETEAKASALGQKLFDLNIAAVNYRYDEEQDATTRAAARWFRYDDKRARCSAVQAYKSVRCLIYQCSEGDTMKSPLYRALERLSDDLADTIVTSLPEWDAAEWDASDERRERFA